MNLEFKMVFLNYFIVKELFLLLKGKDYRIEI